MLGDSVRVIIYHHSCAMIFLIMKKCFSTVSFIESEDKFHRTELSFSPWPIFRIVLTHILALEAFEMCVLGPVLEGGNIADVCASSVPFNTLCHPRPTCDSSSSLCPYSLDFSQPSHSGSLLPIHWVVILSPPLSCFFFPFCFHVSNSESMQMDSAPLDHC